MIDQPDAQALLQAMAKTLSDEVLPATSGATRHSVRVVANLCRILEREFKNGSDFSEQTRKELVELLGHEASLSELVGEFDRKLQGADEAFENSALAVLMRDVERRLAIDKPGYGS